MIGGSSAAVAAAAAWWRLTCSRMEGNLEDLIRPDREGLLADGEIRKHDCDANGGSVDVQGGA